jgi:DNA end-binding protein Ku
MVEEWNPAKYKDTYRDDLQARIREKIAAGETESVTPEAAEEEEAATEGVIDIMSLLKKSVEDAKGKEAKESESEAKKPRKAAASEKRPRAKRKTA